MQTDEIEEERSTMSTKDLVPWSVAIFAARETLKELTKTLSAVINAATEQTIIDILVNGNATLAEDLRESLQREPPIQLAASHHTLRIWHIAQGGKSHAWNQYIHALWPCAGVTFFIDGYVRPEPDALARLAEHLRNAPSAFASTGIPSIGRTAKRIREEMLKNGGLHGNLFALSSNTIDELRRTGFKLALGLYSFDTVLGAILGYGLDPKAKQWDAKTRIIVVPDVTWKTETKRWWHPSDIRTQIKRNLNIAQRVLERKATKYYLQKCQMPIGRFPKHVSDYVLTWMQACPEDAQKTLWQAPLSRLALRRITRPTDWSMARHSPKLVHSGRI